MNSPPPLPEGAAALASHPAARDPSARAWPMRCAMARRREVWVGAESGSQKILDAMNKGTYVAENVRARHLLGNVGIRVGYFLAARISRRALDDILATRRLVGRGARPDDIGVSVS